MTATTATPLEALAQKIVRQQGELEALRREYETRQASLTDLNRQKEALQTQLRQVETDIQAATQGSPADQAPAPQLTRQPKPGARKIKRKKPKTIPSPSKPFRENSLPALLLDIIGKASGPLTVNQLAAEVVRRKYPTTSNNLPAIIETRAGDLVRKGLLRRASGQPGFVTATAGAKASKGKTTSAPNVSTKNGTLPTKAASAEKTDGQQQPLRIIITNLLAKSRRPMMARELAEQVLANGYQTKSKNFIDVVYVALGQMDNIANVAGKGYVLKKG